MNNQYEQTLGHKRQQIDRRLQERKRLEALLKRKQQERQGILKLLALLQGEQIK